jgi:hypothetical protein
MTINYAVYINQSYITTGISAGQVQFMQRIETGDPDDGMTNIAPNGICFNSVDGTFWQNEGSSESTTWASIPVTPVGAVTSTALAVVAATASSGAATGNGQDVLVTTESLTTAAGSSYTLTLTNSSITAGSNLMVTVGLGSATTGIPHLLKVTPGSGSATIVVENIHASAALNGTLEIGVVTLD